MPTIWIIQIKERVRTAHYLILLYSKETSSGGSDKVSTDDSTKAFSTVRFVSSTVSIDDVDASPVDTIDINSTASNVIFSNTGRSTLPTEASTGKSDEAGSSRFIG